MLLAGVAYQELERVRDRTRFRRPGRLISVGSHELHTVENGSGSPTVVLEAGIAGSGLSWTVVHQLVSQFCTVVSYDRAGLGWSEAARSKPSLRQMSDDLEGLLSRGNLPKPYLLVGHSFGALIARAFAFAHSELVAGIVLVDPVSIESWANCSEADARRLALGTRLSRRGALLAKLGVVRIALTLLVSGKRRLPQLISRTSSRKGNRVVERLIGEVKKLPPQTWPAIRSHWSDPKCFRAMADYLECLPQAAELARSMPIPASIPVIVLSAGTATTAELAEREEWVRSHPRSRHLQIEGSGHWIQLERPEIVAEAIRELMKELS